MCNINGKNTQQRQLFLLCIPMLNKCLTLLELTLKSFFQFPVHRDKDADDEG